MRAAQGGSLAARKMIAQRVYNLEPLQRNRFGAHCTCIPFRPYARSPFASPSFPSHMTRGPGPLQGRLARHGHYSVGRILPLRLPSPGLTLLVCPVDIPIRPNCCHPHDKGTGHLSCGFSQWPRPLTGRNSPRFGGSCQAPKLLDCPFFPPMQAPAASYGAF